MERRQFSRWGPRRSRGFHHRLLAAALVAAATVAAGCGSGDATPPDGGESGPERAGAEAPSAARVGGVFFESPEEAAREALALVQAGDAGRLSELALGEAGFRDAVYPRLPASRPERNTSAAFLWEMLHRRSRSSLAYTLDRHGGRRYELIALDFVGETTDYGPFQVHRETVLTVRAPDGERGTLRIFGSLLEQDGRYQIFSFVTD